MHNFIAKFRKILDIYKGFAGNYVTEAGNVPRKGVVPFGEGISCQQEQSYKLG